VLGAVTSSAPKMLVVQSPAGDFVGIHELPCQISAKVLGGLLGFESIPDTVPSMRRTSGRLAAPGTNAYFTGTSP